MRRRWILLFAAVALLVATTTADRASADVDPHRLGDKVVPTRQSAELRLDPGAMEYTGTTVITLRVNEATDRFRLHARELDLRSAKLSGSGGPWTLEIVPGEVDLVEFIAPVRLAVGDYALRLDFENEYDLRAHSLYKLTTEGHDYLFTQFEAIDARAALPCFDEPRFKIPWQMTLQVPEGQLALSNTPVEEETVDGGWITRRFVETPPMPSYLVAIAVGPFETVDVPGADIPTRIITPAGKEALATNAVEVTPPLLKALEDYFDRPYPYRKLDLIAVPEFWPGAMENVGLITFRDTILLLDHASATVAQKRTLAAVTAHEIAHMWFGNLVTMEWWDDLWLNESFATWLGNKITDRVYPEFGLAVTNVRATNGAKTTDSRRSTRAMRAPVSSEGIMESMDAGITYQKGEAVLGMFEAFVGEEAFRDGVRNYIRRNEWKSAVADDFLASIEETTGLAVPEAMSTFLDQPGVPNVRAVALGDGKVELSQSRFTNVGFEPEEEQTWQIPVVFKYSDGEQVRSQRVLLTEPTQIVELPGGITPEWIHPNDGEMGYYRWEVDPDRLFDLVERASAELGVRERVALVGQLSAQLDAGRIGGGDYLRAASILSHDPEPQVLNAALASLGKVRFAFVSGDEIDAFEHYVSATCRPSLERIGITPRKGEGDSVALLRPQLLTWLGMWGNDAEVRAYAREVADRYLADRSSVEASTVGTCLRIAAVDGGWKLYNAYVKAFEAATVPAERQNFLGAIGSFGDRSVQKAALRYALSDATRPQEMFAIPQSVAMRSFDDPDRMWNWFTGNYDAIAEKIPEMFRAFLPYFAGGCEESRLIVAREFFADPAHTVPGQETHLERVAETVQQCADLRRREGASVKEFLAEYGRGD